MRHHVNTNLISNNNVTVSLPIHPTGQYTTASDRHRYGTNTCTAARLHNKAIENCDLLLLLCTNMSTARLFRTFVLEVHHQTAPQTKDSVDNGFVIANPFHPKKLYTNYIIRCRDTFLPQHLLSFGMPKLVLAPPCIVRHLGIILSCFLRILVKTLSCFPQFNWKVYSSTYITNLVVGNSKDNITLKFV